MRLILLEDNPRLRFLLDEAINDAGWRVDGFADIATACEAVATISYDMALVDLGLPDGDGITFICELRANGFQAPVLIITARAAIEDRILGLDAGADDYLVKPFNHNELLARCRALLRRSPMTITSEILVGRLCFSPALQRLTCEDDEIALSRRESSLLELLLRNVGHLIAKERIESSLSDLDRDTSTNALELIVSRLRKKLNAYESEVSIETVCGLGYMLRDLSK